MASINNLISSTYTVTVTDANSCTANAQATITQASSISANTSSTPSTCGAGDGTATVIASGGTPGYTYLLSLIHISEPTRPY